MYPSLMVAGGIVTLTWDNRQRLIIPLTSLFPSKRSASTQTHVALARPDLQAQEDPEAVEQSDRAAKSTSRLIDESVNDVPVSVGTSTLPEVADNISTSPPLCSSAAPRPLSPSSGMHQRPRPLDYSVEPEQPNIGESTPLVTLGTKPAIALAMAFVALVISFVAMKATVDSLSRAIGVSDPPRQV